MNIENKIEKLNIARTTHAARNVRDAAFRAYVIARKNSDDAWDDWNITRAIRDNAHDTWDNASAIYEDSCSNPEKIK